MTVQQHAPTLEHARPPLAISPAAAITFGIVVIAVLAALAVWALFAMNTGIDSVEAEEMLQQIRVSTGGFI
jgi:hypothetical protein